MPVNYYHKKTYTLFSHRAAENINIKPFVIKKAEVFLFRLSHFSSFFEFPFCVMRYWISCNSLRIDTHTHTNFTGVKSIFLLPPSTLSLTSHSRVSKPDFSSLSHSLLLFFIHSLWLICFSYSSLFWLIKKQYKIFCSLPCIFALNSISKSSFCQGLGNYSDRFHSVLWR